MAIDPRRIEVIDDRTAAVYRRMTPAERMGAVNTMFRQCVQMVEWGLRTLHADRGEAWVRAEVIRRVRDGSV
ncbi:MAG: hypothetical protein ACOYN0_17675 [Phycisphaerales bacterium]